MKLENIMNMKIFLCKSWYFFNKKNKNPQIFGAYKHQTKWYHKICSQVKWTIRTISFPLFNFHTNLITWK